MTCLKNVTNLSNKMDMQHASGINLQQSGVCENILYYYSIYSVLGLLM